MGRIFDDIVAVDEGNSDHAAMQRIINDGSGWRMQGSMGRAMMAAIEAGECMLGKSVMTDYWGNRIPSRYHVQAGTKGSREYVAEMMGEEHAAEMEKL